MHIEKNVCDSLLGTLLNLDGKTKDHENSRLDLQDMGIRRELHPVYLDSGKKYLPSACFSMSKREKELFLEVLQNSGNATVEFPIFSNPGRHIGRKDSIVFDKKTLTKAHQYVLFNCHSINSFIEQHKTIVKNQNTRLSLKDVESIHSDTFSRWFKNYVENMHLNGNPVSKELRALAQGPNPVGRRYRGFIVNGFRFHVKKFEKRRRTQNSGLVVTAQTSSYASRNDANPIVGDVTYYGVLKDIIELDYFEGGKIVLFECDWVSPGRAQKQDETGFTLVNFSRSRQHNEPFVLASQAQQIFYIEDPIEKRWQVVVRAKARDSFDMDPILSLDGGTFQYTASNDGQLHAGDEQSNWVWVDVEGIVVVEIEK